MRWIFRASLFVPSMAIFTTAGCTDRIPTLSGEGPFPVGGVGTTIEYIVEAPTFLLDTDVYRGTTDAGDARRTIVAEAFDGDLTAHVLSTFDAFPDTILVGGESDGDFQYLGSQVVASVPDTLGASAPELTLLLWTVEQSWEPGAVTWENAVDEPGDVVPWTEAGGTRGQLLAATTWDRADADAAGDSLSWSIPASVATALANDELPGLMVTLEDTGERVGISTLEIRASIQPSVQPDTVVTRTVRAASQTFVYTPDTPHPGDLLRIGGVTSDRSVLRLEIPTELPGCTTDQTCPSIPAEEVSLDRVDLVLDPVPVANGFRPVSPLPLMVRTVLQLDLGDRAPLGPRVTFRDEPIPIAPERFTVGDDQEIFIPITTPFASILAPCAEDPIDCDRRLGIALLVEPEASTFGYGWFERNPRIRIIYTLPQIPQLP